jgi:hypothetical protein
VAAVVAVVLFVGLRSPSPSPPPPWPSCVWELGSRVAAGRVRALVRDDRCFGSRRSVTHAWGHLLVSTYGPAHLFLRGRRLRMTRLFTTQRRLPKRWVRPRGRATPQSTVSVCKPAHSSRLTVSVCKPARITRHTVSVCKPAHSTRHTVSVRKPAHSTRLTQRLQTGAQHTPHSVCLSANRHAWAVPMPETISKT